MGRAVRPRRERLSRNSTGPTRALSLRPCRSAGPASCPSFSGGLSRLPRAAVRLTLAGLLLVGAGTVAAPAFADVLVKNISKSQTNAPSVDSSYPGRAQAFTTGNHSDGYRLTSVEVALPNAPGASADITVTIRADSSGSPSSSIFATLTNPSDVATDGTKQFSAPTGTILAANRTYWVYLQRNSGTFSVSETASDDEDSGGATGWSIGNDHKYIASNDTAGTSSHSLRIGVNGVMIRDVEKIEVTSTPTSGTTPKKYGAGEKFQVTVTFDEAVTVTGDPEFEIKLGNSGQAVAKRAAYISGSGSTALVFEYTVLATDMDDNGIWIEADALKLDSDDLIQDGDGNNKDLRAGWPERPQGGRQPDTAHQHRPDGVGRGGGHGPFDAWPERPQGGRQPDAAHQHRPDGVGRGGEHEGGHGLYVRCLGLQPSTRRFGTNSRPAAYLSGSGTTARTRDSDGVRCANALTLDTLDTDAFADFIRDSDDALDPAVKDTDHTSLPASGKGTLTLDGTAIESNDLPKTVTKAEIDDDKLKYTPAEDGERLRRSERRQRLPSTTFTFKVTTPTASARRSDGDLRRGRGDGDQRGGRAIPDHRLGLDGPGVPSHGGCGGQRQRRRQPTPTA